MIEKSFAPRDPASAPTQAPRYPNELPAIVRRYMWRDEPDVAPKGSAAAADDDHPEGRDGARP